MSEVTELLRRVHEGEAGAEGELVQRVYARLRAIAATQAGGSDTLQPTALVNEAYLKMLAGESNPKFEDRNHFFGAAARAMRQVAVDHARERHAQKRGGDWKRTTLTDLDLGDGPSEGGAVDALAIEEALAELARLSPRQARIVELRFFGGLRVEDVAHLLGVSPRTVELEWRTARAWLGARLGDA